MLLNALLMWVFLNAGKNIMHGEKFWPNAWKCILCFTFVQGSRYMRGNDYSHYQDVFNGEYLLVENTFFQSFNNLLKNVGINEYSCFAVYAFVFIFCGMHFLHFFRKYALYLFPLFILGYMQFEEYMIRQAFSYSFFFLFLIHLFSFRLDRIELNWHKLLKLFYCLLFSLFVVSFHVGNIINILIFTFFFFFWRKPLSTKYTIPFYVFCVYILSNIFDYSYLSFALSFASDNNDLAAQYVDHSDRWFSEEGKESKYIRNGFIQLLEIAGVSALCYLTPRTIKLKGDQNVVITTFFNVAFIGFCISATFRELEILNRIGHVLSYGWCVVVAFLLYYRPVWKQMDMKAKFSYLCLLWFIYDYLKYLFLPGDKTLFVWDA